MRRIRPRKVPKLLLMKRLLRIPGLGEDFLPVDTPAFKLFAACSLTLIPPCLLPATIQRIGTTPLNIRGQSDFIFPSRRKHSPGSAFGLLTDTTRTGLLCWPDRDVAKEDVAFFAALKVDGAGLTFAAVERAAGKAGNFLVVDDDLAVLKHCDFASDQRDI